MIPRSVSTNGWRAVLAAALLLTLGGGPIERIASLALADEDDAESAISVPSRVTVENGVSVLTLDPAAQQNAGIETAHPSLPPAQGSATGYGAVIEAASLADLNNRYLDAKAQVQTAAAKLAVSRAAFDRAKTLYKDRQNISEAQLQSAEGSFEVDQAALAAAQSHLTTVAASAQQAWGPVIGKALIDGAALVRGLIERRDYLVKVTLPPGGALAAPPATATARLGNGSEAPLHFVSPATAADPKLQGTSYFYIASAESGVLPGLNAMVSMPTGHAPEGVIVPGSAVVWLEGKPWIYLRTGPQTFVRRQIAAEQGAPQGGYVVSGLSADAEIAVRGVQMLLSEEFRAKVHSEEDER
jgi:hypothetical protein